MAKLALTLSNNQHILRYINYAITVTNNLLMAYHYMSHNTKDLPKDEVYNSILKEKTDFILAYWIQWMVCAVLFFFFVV